jgi:hypothetical protein
MIRSSRQQSMHVYTARSKAHGGTVRLTRCGCRGTAQNASLRRHGAPPPAAVRGTGKSRHARSHYRAAVLSTVIRWSIYICLRHRWYHGMIYTATMVRYKTLWMSPHLSSSLPLAVAATMKTTFFTTIVLLVGLAAASPVVPTRPCPARSATT